MYAPPVPTPSTVTVVVPARERDTLRHALAAAGWRDAAAPAYALWAARGPGANAVCYTSGKVVFQGKGAADAAAEFLGADRAPTSRLERITVPAAGSDESGKGDVFGPLVVGAALVRPGQEELLETLGVRDSKAMSDAEVLEAATGLAAGFPSAVVSISPSRYNEMHPAMGANLNRLLAWAHAAALEELLSRPDAADAGRVVVDEFAAGDLLRRTFKPKAAALPLDQRPRAESHPAVAVASVLARAGFLRALRRLGEEIGVPLAKGAGPPADGALRRVVAKAGADALPRVAKMHFRNVGRLR